MRINSMLLEDILRRIADTEDKAGPIAATPSTFADLVAGNGAKASEGAGKHDLGSLVAAHLSYLETQGYIAVGRRQFADHWSGLRVTARGRRFLQPDMAHFDRDFLPGLVSHLQQRIDASEQDAASKAAWKLRLRDALSRDDPASFADTVALIVTKFGPSR